MASAESKILETLVLGIGFLLIGAQCALVRLGIQKSVATEKCLAALAETARDIHKEGAKRC